MAMRQIVFASLALLAAAAAVAAPERIVVRATSVLPDAVDAELRNVGEPETITVAGGINVENELRNHCGGSVSNQYRKAFAELNPGSSLLPAKTDRDLQFPACARVQRLVDAVPVPPNDTPELFLQRILGAKFETKLLICQPDLPNGKPGSCTTQTMREIIAAQINRSDGRFDLVVPPVAKLRIPFGSSWTTIVLKADKTPEEAMRRLREAAAASDAGAGLLDVAPSPVVELLAPLSSDDERLKEGPCSPATAVPPNWPYNRAEVRKAIDAALAYIATKPDRAGRGRASVVRVADTGVSLLNKSPGFPKAFLAVNPNAREGANRLDPDTKFVDAYYGIDAEGRGDVTPRPADPTGWHGTEVANLALGGSALRDEYGALAQLVNLSVARVFTDRFGAGIWVNGATLNSAVTYNPPQADIINFSVGGPDQLQSFYDILMHLFEHRQLVVIAAGNEGKDLGDRPMYPAAYSSEGRIQNSLLVVGAYGPVPPSAMPVRAGFSNYGVNHVDLLAPGCRIHPAYSPTSDLAGTSFAAPLVAFTAALIRDFLYEPQSRTIRERLWASTRWVSEDVAEKTGFGGVLDIPAALRIFDDVARLKGGELEPGRWLEPARFQPCSDYPALPPRLVLRVRVEQREKAPPLLHLLRRDNTDKVFEDLARCTAANDDGPRMLLDKTGEEKLFHWSELETFIPAADADNRRGAGDASPPVPATVAPTLAPIAAVPAGV
jgi:subtilisin family serine protease